MAFRVGQKVVCVDDAGVDPTTLSQSSKPPPLKVGSIYTVAATGLIHPWDLLDRPCIAVGEIAYYHAYLASRFRPIVERKTDISIFTKMLTGSKHEAVS